MLTVSLTPDELLSLTTVAYRDWLKAHATHIHVLREKNDSSRDWLLFHEERRLDALQRETAAYALLQRLLIPLKKYNPEFTLPSAASDNYTGV